MAMWIYCCTTLSRIKVVFLSKQTNHQLERFFRFKNKFTNPLMCARGREGKDCKVIPSSLKKQIETKSGHQSRFLFSGFEHRNRIWLARLFFNGSFVFRMIFRRVALKKILMEINGTKRSQKCIKSWWWFFCVLGIETGCVKDEFSWILLMFYFEVAKDLRFFLAFIVLNFWQALNFIDLFFSKIFSHNFFLTFFLCFFRTTFKHPTKNLSSNS